MDIAHIKRETTDTYLKEIWNERIEKKIDRKVLKGKSRLFINAFRSKHSSEMLARIGKDYGYDTEVVLSALPFAKFKIFIKW